MQRLALVLASLTIASSALAQTDTHADQQAAEEAWERLVITPSASVHVTPLAVLPSLSSDYSDVVLRGVVRRDLELSGLFRVIPDAKAPPGLYGFSDAVDLPAWKKLGAEVIVKVAARPLSGGKVEVLGLAYFLDVGKEPVYEKRFVVDKDDVRQAAHRVTDALLGAITGRPGGFSSHLAFADRWASTNVVFTMDADGHDLKRATSTDFVSIAPTWGPSGELFFSASRDYAPFEVMSAPKNAKKNPFGVSIFGTAFDNEQKRVAYAVAQPGGSAIWVGPLSTVDAEAPARESFAKQSKTEVATHPVFGPDGEVAWVGGDTGNVRRIYVNGKPVSPPGMTAAAPTFCDTADGTVLVYAVRVGASSYDLIASDPDGQGLRRLTQHQGSNTYPACSPDGRLVAFFSTRKGSSGIYLLSLKTRQTHKVSSRMGQSLQWAALPEPAAGGAKKAKKKGGGGAHIGKATKAGAIKAPAKRPVVNKQPDAPKPAPAAAPPAAKPPPAKPAPAEEPPVTTPAPTAPPAKPTPEPPTP